MSEEELADITYQKLGSILDGATRELSSLRQVTPAGPTRGNISDYLQTFIILRRSAIALRGNTDENENQLSPY